MFAISISDFQDFNVFSLTYKKKKKKIKVHNFLMITYRISFQVQSPERFGIRQMVNITSLR